MEKQKGLKVSKGGQHHIERTLLVAVGTNVMSFPQKYQCLSCSGICLIFLAAIARLEAIAIGL